MADLLHCIEVLNADTSIFYIDDILDDYESRITTAEKTALKDHFGDPDYSYSTVVIDGAKYGTYPSSRLWSQCGPKLVEGLAHLFGLIMRRAGGDASVALRVSFA